MNSELREECAELGKAYNDGYKQGASDMENAKQIIIDSLLEQIKSLEKQIIDYIVDSIIFPLLDECDIGLWKHIDYIELAEKWVDAIDKNQYPMVKNCDKARKEYLKKWITEQLKERK